MILNINKPIGWTSFDVVKKVRWIIKEKKVGHGGTLDPFAEGVLMLCTGEYTKKVEYFMNKEKEYIAKIHLGIETDTLDPTGRIVKIAKVYVGFYLNEKFLVKHYACDVTYSALNFCKKNN